VYVLDTVCYIVTGSDLAVLSWSAVNKYTVNLHDYNRASVISITLLSD
jgi:hypothetical protein